MKKKLLVCLCVIGVIFQGSSVFAKGISQAEVDGIRERAYNAAVGYTKNFTVYRSGACDDKGHFFDCSGLVIRCYDDALKGTKYKLPFTFATKGHPRAIDLYNKYTVRTTKPKKGDLIFIDFDDDGELDHVGIFRGFTTKGNCKFIDSSNYWKYKKDVDERSIRRDDHRIVGYGIMKLKYR